MRPLILVHIWGPEVHMLPYVESPFLANGMIKITKVISWNACKKPWASEMLLQIKVLGTQAWWPESIPRAP